MAFFSNEKEINPSSTLATEVTTINNDSAYKYKERKKFYNSWFGKGEEIWQGTFLGLEKKSWEKISSKGWKSSIVILANNKNSVCHTKLVERAYMVYVMRPCMIR